MRRWITTVVPLALAPGLLLTPNTASGQNPNPYARPNGSWITMGGTVQDLTPSSFTLNYGRGVVEVEMDRSDQSAETGMIQDGDTVDVTGRVDDDFFENETIAAGSVYDARLDTYFYSSAMEDEDKPWATMRLDQPFTTVFRGMVTQVGEDEFTIDRGPRKVTVWVDKMQNSPLDDVGPEKLKVGDFVAVTAEIDRDLFLRRRLEALDVTQLYHD